MCQDGMEASKDDQFCGLGSLVVQNSNEGEISIGLCSAGDGEEGPKHVHGITNLAILDAQNLESKALRRHLGLDELDFMGSVRNVGGRSLW